MSVILHIVILVNWRIQICFEQKYCISCKVNLKIKSGDVSVKFLYVIGVYSKNWVLAESSHADTRKSSKFGGIYFCD